METSKSKPQRQLEIENMASLKSWGDPPSALAPELTQETVIDCGWGRLIFGQTFSSNSRLAQELKNEQPGRRDVALYTRDPHVVVSKDPQALFIDPSLTYRLELPTAELALKLPEGVQIRSLTGGWDEYHINRIYKARGMVELKPRFSEHLLAEPALKTLVAVDQQSGNVIGCVAGVDHYCAFGDPDNGCSLWALAVDPQCLHPGIGRALVTWLAQDFKQAGRAFMDLSVMHDNAEAIQLYQSLGFYQVPVYCVKTKNVINEQLYVGPRSEESLNVYAQIIVDEACRRGIAVDIVDASGGFFDLSLGGRTVNCRESLTELTSAVALSRCDDKSTTRRFLQRAGLKVPEQQELQSENDALEFLTRHQRVVVKPARGEQGAGVFVDLRAPDETAQAFHTAAGLCDKVLGESFVVGEDLRILVINKEVVAAAIRRPASIMGDGFNTVRRLIEKQSRRRSSATQGESTIPLDAETRRCVNNAGYEMEQVLPNGEEIQVRKAANLHTGGTLHDVTAALHPVLREAAVKAAQVLGMPLVGLDFIVESADQPNYAIIEANERPGLANHEPQPTAERMLDMLFPQTADRSLRPRYESS